MISIGSPRSAMACAAAMRCPPLNASRFASAAARRIVFSAEIEVGESDIARVYLKPSSPANGSAEWPPDDRLQRVIQYPGSSVMEPRSHNVLDAPPSRSMTERAAA